MIAYIPVSLTNRYRPPGSQAPATGPCPDGWQWSSKLLSLVSLYTNREVENVNEVDREA